jgi:hypothetical protein
MEILNQIQIDKLVKFFTRYSIDRLQLFNVHELEEIYECYQEVFYV